MNPDELAFLRSIWRRPTDHAPRLVYADWLDEHGHAWEASAVRYWCQLRPADRDILIRDGEASLTNCSAEFVFGSLAKRFILYLEPDEGKHKRPGPLLRRLVRLRPYVLGGRRP